MDKITSAIKAIENQYGILTGWTHLEDKEKNSDDEIKKTSAELDYALSIAFPLNREILRTIIDRPTIIYKHHYQQVNYLLDRISLKIAHLIERKGYRALPIPASIFTNRSEFRAHLCHRTIAFQAGIGWWGKNNLIVNPVFGAGIRLSTILTNLPPPSAISQSKTNSINWGCGSCSACAERCPAKAIGRDISEFNRIACFTQVKEFERRVIGVGICGICLATCREVFEKNKINGSY